MALIRRNSLFSYGESGARSSMIVLSLIETARAAGVDPYCYLKYALEKMSLKINYYHKTSMDDLMPWSDQYLAYQAAHNPNRFNQMPIPVSEKPDSPKIRYRKKIKPVA